AGRSRPPGGSCTFNVTFSASQTFREEALLTVSDSANNSPQETVMYGTGMSGPATLSPSSLTFGNQAVGTASAPQSVTLSNPGSIPMSIYSFPISATYVGAFAESTNCPKCPQTLAAGASCT